MPYRLMRPVDFQAGKKYPVIISLHGAGQRGNDNSKQLKAWPQQLANDDIRKKFPAYVLAPQSNSHWEIERFEKVKGIIKNLPVVDMQRIYIMGHSMGGHGTFLWTQYTPEYFAAAAPVQAVDARGVNLLSPNS